MGPDRMAAAVFDLRVPDSWPPDLLSYLREHDNLFLDWEDGHTGGTAQAYDAAIHGLRNVLQQYAITGWHCTRLTEEEITGINSDGIQLPDTAMIERRIDAALALGHLTKPIASKLKAKHQASMVSRAGMVWFCFFPPRLAGEDGVGRFFRFWGGEALYSLHENDPETGAAIRSIGVPCLVEADVPIASLEPHGGLSRKIVRRFLIAHGYQTREPVEHEDRIKCPLSAGYVRRVIRHPEPDFLKLTDCNDWDIQLT